MGAHVISFSKMQGLGNDFMVIDGTKEPQNFTPEQIKKMSDRKYGVGFDQLLMVEMNPDHSADFNYRIFNSDGSESYQCGNGARCVARFIRSRGLSDKKSISLKTRQVSMTLSVLPDNQVKVLLDPPSFEAPSIPLNLDQTGPLYSIDYNEGKVEFYALNVGNPHAVILGGGGLDIDEVGPFLGQQPCFPEGVNVGLVDIKTPQEIDLKVFERGVGRTLACGSGACAAAVAGLRSGRLKGQVCVRQEGGDLLISWAGEGKPIEMIGPAEFVFEGKYGYT